MSDKIEENEQGLVEGEENASSAAENSEEESNRDPLLSDGKGPEFKWYIIKTLTGQENKISKALRERIVNYKMGEYFSEILIPEETVVSHANGKKRSIKKKFFPGYVLLKMVMNDNTWHLVKDTDKVTGFIGGAPNKPSPISDKEAAYMIGQFEEGVKKPRTSVKFSEGETVKVIEGPFTSFVGTIEAVSDKGKIKVNVSIFGRPTPVELDFTQVERVS